MAQDKDSLVRVNVHFKFIMGSCAQVNYYENGFPQFVYYDKKYS